MAVPWLAVGRAGRRATMRRTISGGATSLALCAALLAAACAKREPFVPPQWVSTPQLNSCDLTTGLHDSGGTNRGNLRVTWAEGEHYILELRLTRQSSEGWHFEAGDAGGQREYNSGNTPFQLAGLDKGEHLMRDLSDGKAVAVRYESGARIGAPTAGAETMRAFQKCIADIRARPPPEPPPARWTVESQSGRDCSLRLSRFENVPALNFSFRLNERGDLGFALGSNDPQAFPDGGEFRVEGAAERFDLEMDRGPQAQRRNTMTLLTSLRKSVPLDMTFTPKGGKRLRLKITTAGLDVRGAMFEACVRALDEPVLPPRHSLRSVRFTVSENENVCELTGVYQVYGNSLWLTHVTDGEKNLLKVTRRVGKSQNQVGSLDLSRLGGPKDFDADDGSFEIPAAAFTALRKDLRGAGRGFGMNFTSGKTYDKVSHGGSFALVEAPMFDACVRVKHESARARAAS